MNSEDDLSDIPEEARWVYVKEPRFRTFCARCKNRMGRHYTFVTGTYCDVNQSQLAVPIPSLLEPVDGSYPPELEEEMWP